MRFMLDTNAVSAVMKKDPKVIRKVMQYGVDEICMSALTLYELRRGAWRVTDAKTRAALLHRIDALPFQVLPLEAMASDAAGKAQGRLQADGQGVEDMDALIGMHAHSAGLVLATRNVDHFERLPGLHVLNWQ